MDISPAEKRRDLIDGLRALADFIELNPDVPTPNAARTALCVRVDGDHEKAAEIERIARVLGAEINPDDLMYGHITTRRCFGPVEYEAFAITDEARARSAAFNSYFGHVEPEEV